MSNTWVKKDLLKMIEMKKHGKSIADIAKVLNRSAESVYAKMHRINWKVVDNNPDKFVEEHQGSNPRKWSNDEMIQLDAYIQAGQSYDFIAQKLCRGIVSVERKAQDTDWKAWRAINNINGEGGQIDGDSFIESEIDRVKMIDSFVNSILSLGRGDPARLNGITEKEFLKKVNLDKKKLFISFAELKEKAEKELTKIGFKNPEEVRLGEGTYLVVGDSHGKHTKRSMFRLLEQVNRYVKPDKIIHIGHILDDDNDISYDWGKFNNLIIVAREEELRTIQDQRNKFKFNFDVVRFSAHLGELEVSNQEMISDYVKTSIASLDPEIFNEQVIVNCHRVESFTRCTNEKPSYMVSPGCICEEHIITTIKQIDFDGDHTVKQANWTGFSKYRRWRHMSKYWEQGMIVVHVDKHGNHTVIPCVIQKVQDGFGTSYFDKIITSQGVFDPDKKIFVNGDLHCDLHDADILDIQEQICKDYKPDIQVNLGDTINNKALNHHFIDKGIPILNKKIMDESAQTYAILKRMSSWAKESHMIYGNHERFAQDFVDKNPQFGDMLDFRFLCSLEEMGYQLTELKDVLKINGVKFVHGDIVMYGQPGTKIEKCSRTFGRDVFVGHIHCPAIRFGCFSIGLTGKIDQEYNEPNASKWVQGFGMCNQYKGKNWATTIAIINRQCILNKKLYKPIDPSSWQLKGYKARIVYDVK
jgi:predicted phosphodiesterase